jgi:hypothetical protein
MVQSALTESVSAAAAHARRRGYAGPLLVHAQLESLKDDKLLAVDDHVGQGVFIDNMQIIPGSRNPHRITPIQTEVAADAEPAALRLAVRRLCEDFLHQLGVSEIDVPT